MLFDPFTLGGVQLRNRIFRSATHEGLADAAGRPTERLRKRYQQLARGGVGAIVTGYAGVAVAGKSAAFRMLMIDRDELIPAHRDLVRAVHALETPIFLQLAHCGPQTRRVATGEAPLTPSGLRSQAFPGERPRALSDPQIQEIVQAFVCAVGRAREAGYDGVQLHAAHGYLLSSFLSPRTNLRADRWGGSTDNRARIVLEILAAARACAPGFPILAKINGRDGRRGGMRPDEAARLAVLLERAGCAAIEVSCGVYDDGFDSVRCGRVPGDGVLAYLYPYREWPGWLRHLAAPLVPLLVRAPRPTHAYNLPEAARIRSAVRIPVIAVGGLRQRAEMEAILAHGDADLVAMSRPFIREPDIVARLRDGRQEGSSCRDCGYCGLSQELEPLHCHDGRLRRIAVLSH